METHFLSYYSPIAINDKHFFDATAVNRFVWVRCDRDIPTTPVSLGIGNSPLHTPPEQVAYAL